MKRSKNLRTLVLLGLFLMTISCVKNDEYDVPPISTEDPEIIVNSSIEALKEAWKQNYTANGALIYTFESSESEVYLEGYVVSSDLAGNFYKKLIVQDAIENAQHGIEILIDKTSLFESFEVGRKIYIKADGLSITYEDGDENDPFDGVPGRYKLGSLINGSVEEIPSFTFAENVIRSNEVELIEPTLIHVKEFDESYINTMIQIQDIQFELSELGKTYAGESSDEYDGMRQLLSCNDAYRATLQTSSFSDFKSYVIADGKGSLNAILTKDFYGDFYVLIINDPTDIDFSEDDRCDPEILDCGSVIEGGSEVLFFEDFESTSEAELLSNGWLNTNIEGGSNDFSLRKYGGNSYMQASAFNSDENPLEVWLISPAIDLSLTSNEELTFKTQAGYFNGDALAVYVSTNFIDDIESADWILVTADLADGPVNGYGTTFTKSGLVNLSCLEGDVHVAFRYVGADNGITTTFRIEDVKVTGTSD